MMLHGQMLEEHVPIQGMANHLDMKKDETFYFEIDDVDLDKSVVNIQPTRGGKPGYVPISKTNIKKIISEQEYITCPFCGRGFISELKLTKHIDDEHPDQPFSTESVKKTPIISYIKEKLIDPLTKRKREGQESQPLTTPNRTAQNSSPLRTSDGHNATHNDLISDNRNAKPARDTAEGWKKFTCPHCTYFTFKLDDFQVHMLADHNSEYSGSNKEVAPSNVQKQPSRDQLRASQGQQSQGKQSPRKKYNCQLCAYFSNELDEFQVHMLTDHNREYSEEKSHQRPQIEEAPPPYCAFEIDKLQHVKQLKSYQLGRWRGIQGENNSCYLDAALFAMFAFNSHFDHMLEDNKEDDARHRILRERLRTDIVNELRGRFFVNRSSVVQWRRIIDPLFEGNNFNQACFERDVEEFLRFLFHQLKVPPFLTITGPSLKSEYHSHMYQVLLSDSLPEQVATTQKLVEDSLRIESLVFKSVPDVLILLMPRHGKKKRLLKGIIPNLQLSLPVEGSRSLDPNMSLFAVSCIGSSHYVTYATTEDRNWYFFDSMSDRVKEENVPLVEDVTSALEYLNLDWSHDASLLQESSPKLQRLAQDLSVCFYQKLHPPSVK